MVVDTCFLVEALPPFWQRMLNFAISGPLHEIIILGVATIVHDHETHQQLCGCVISYIYIHGYIYVHEWFVVGFDV